MSGRWLRWTGYGMAIGTVVLAVVLASRFGTDPGLVQSPLLGQPAPGFQLETLDGEKTVDLATLEGDIVIINFFASWCLECRAEHADLVATADAFEGRDVTFVQVSYQEDSDDTLAYLKEVGNSSGTVYLQDEASRTAIAYGVFGIPETYFIDANGVVVGKIIGETDAFTLGGTIDAIMRGESPGQTVTGDTQQQP